FQKRGVCFMGLIDLHLHSTASDGTYTPREVVSHAKERDLQVIALSDHDTLAGIPEALKAGEELGVMVIPAVEINTDYKNTEVHILGYGIDYNCPALRALCRETQDKRVTRA